MTESRRGSNPLFEWAPASLLEMMSDGVSIQDRDMRIRYANRSHRDAFGHDIVGKLCYEVYERRSQCCQACPVKECLATGRPASAQRAGVDENGARWFADITATPLRSPDGDIVGALELVRNITERKLIEEEADRRNRETAALAEIAMALNSCTSLDNILDVALKRSVELCGAVGGLIRLLDKAGQLVTCTWYTTTNEPILDAILPPQRLGVGVIGRAAETRRIEIVDDISGAAGVAKTDHGQGLIKLGLNSMVIVPLHYRDDLIGTMALGSFEKAKFRGVDQGLLSAVAGQISISIAAARLSEEADKEALVDRE